MANLRIIGTDLNRQYRNDLNWNFQQIEEEILGLGDTSSEDKAELLAELARIERESKERDDLLAGTDVAALIQSIEDAKAAANMAAAAANVSAGNADTKATHAQTQGDYAKTQGDYAKTQGDYARDKALEADAAAANANAEAANLDGIKVAAMDATQAANTAADNAVASVTDIQNLESKGEYDPATAYKKNNVVRFEGAGYIAVADSTGKPVTDGSFWRKLVDRGEKGDQGVQGPQGEKGDTGEKGETGAGVNIIGSLASEDELPASGTTGDAYMIAGNLFVWNGTAWENVGNIQGPKGDTGAKGERGEKGDPFLYEDFTPEQLADLKGDKGDTGPKGDPGEQGLPGEMQDLTPIETQIMNHEELIASPTALGHVKIGENLTITLDGTLSATGGTVLDASITQKGIVQLNNTLTSTLTTQAATANAVKQVNDKLIGTSIELGANASAFTRAVTIGSSAVSTGNSDVVIGIGAKTEGSATGRIAIGWDAKVTNTTSHNGGIAIGRYAQANYDGAAFGASSQAVGKQSVALGANSIVTGDYSAAIGNRVSVLNSNEGVLGYNDTFSPNKWKVDGAFSVAGTKNFEIPHPHPNKKDTHFLRHAAVESPSAGDTLYRYTVEAHSDGETVARQLPDYFQHLNKDVDVWVNGDGHFGRAFGSVEDDTLSVTCELAGSYKVLVIGTRNDDHDSVQSWDLKGVEREIGESWTGETYVFEDDEIIAEEEYITEVVA